MRGTRISNKTKIVSRVVTIVTVLAAITTIAGINMASFFTTKNGSTANPVPTEEQDTVRKSTLENTSPTIEPKKTSGDVHAEAKQTSVPPGLTVDENPSTPLQVQNGGTNNNQIGTVVGDLTINQNKVASEAFEGATPQDIARNKLQKIGVTWNLGSYIQAIVDGDERAVQLFLDGGMTPQVKYKGAWAVAYCLQPNANNRAQILKLMIANGFAPNDNLIDARVLTAQSNHNSLPVEFESAQIPEEYQAWKNQFAGPADLWLAMRGAYAGTEPADFEQLEILAKNGANFHLSLEFLVWVQRYWGDTPVYWDVREEVEKLAGIPITPRKLK